MNDRIRLAKFMFSLDAVLGILVVGAACLFGAAYSRHANLWTIFLTIFAPLAVVWSLLCYCAYKVQKTPYPPCFGLTMHCLSRC